MPSLRKYIKDNKIKNRYIITMKYKSKKINKRMYVKRQSRKLIKRGMYGGRSEIAASDIMKQIEEDNKLNLTKLPVAGPIIEKTGNLLEGTVIKGLDMIGDSIGVDIDNPESIGEKLDDIKNAISSPENKKKTKEILENSGEYAGLVVDAAAPVIEKTSEKILPVVMKEADKAVGAIVKTELNLAEDVAGPIVGFPRTVWSAMEALNASVNAGSELIKGTAEAIQGTQENLNRLKEEGASKIPKVPEIGQKITQNIPVETVDGSSLKKYQKEKRMIGGRILQSQSEFLGGQLNSSQILKQYGGKWKTKHRHYLKRKITSRSYK